MDLRDIKPIGNFILANAEGTMWVDGMYYHYTDVCKLLGLYKEKLLSDKPDEIDKIPMKYILENKSHCDKIASLLGWSNSEYITVRYNENLFKICCYERQRVFIVDSYGSIALGIMNDDGSSFSLELEIPNEDGIRAIVSKYYILKSNPWVGE